MRAGLDLPAPPLDAPRGHGGSDWVRLTRAMNDIDAHLLTGRLGEAGIESHFVKDRDVPGAWLHGGANPWAPVTILVRRHRFDDARVVLAEIAYDAPPLDPEDTRPADAPRVAVRWWVAALVLGVLLSAVGLVRTVRMIEAGRGHCAVPLVCDSTP